MKDFILNITEINLEDNQDSKINCNYIPFHHLVTYMLLKYVNLVYVFEIIKQTFL